MSILCRRLASRSKNFLNKYSYKKYSTKREEINCCQISDALNKETITLGQPTYWTHPHLFELNSSKNDDVTPAISKREFEQRRDTYVTYLTNYQKYYFDSQKQSSSLAVKNNVHDISYTDNNFISIIPSCMTTFMAPDVPYTFKQNSDFLYLTGFKEPNSLIVFSRTSKDNNNSYKVALFVREKNRSKEIWEGAFSGPENVNKICGIEKAYNIKEFEKYITSLIKENENKKLTLWRYPTDEVMKHEQGPNCYNELVENTLTKLENEHKNRGKLILMNELDTSVLHSSRYFVQMCRIKKSKAEIDLMRKSCDIASTAFINTMLASHANVNESLLYAKFDYECRLRGAQHLAYIPVIAGGPRATILHYIRNDQLVMNNRLLLMDAGCQYNDYVSDITRTWPINGQFTSAQRELYEACLNVQQHCLEQCKSGTTINKLYQCMIKKLGEQLVQLGILKASDVVVNDNYMPITSHKNISEYCPHDIGHYVGLDVHDSPEISKGIELEPGTVITIEPGRFKTRIKILFCVKFVIISSFKAFM